MARMNPRRRRLAAQAKVLQSIVAEHGPAHGESQSAGAKRAKLSQWMDCSPAAAPLARAVGAWRRGVAAGAGGAFGSSYRIAKPHRQSIPTADCRKSDAICKQARRFFF